MIVFVTTVQIDDVRAVLDGRHDGCFTRSLVDHTGPRDVLSGLGEGLGCVTLPSRDIFHQIGLPERTTSDHLDQIVTFVKIHR